MEPLRSHISLKPYTTFNGDTSSVKSCHCTGACIFLFPIWFGIGVPFRASRSLKFPPPHTSHASSVCLVAGRFMVTERGPIFQRERHEAESPSPLQAPPKPSNSIVARTTAIKRGNEEGSSPLLLLLPQSQGIEVQHPRFGANRKAYHARITSSGTRVPTVALAYCRVFCVIVRLAGSQGQVLYNTANTLYRSLRTFYWP